MSRVPFSFPLKSSTICDIPDACVSCRYSIQLRESMGRSTGQMERLAIGIFLAAGLPTWHGASARICQIPTGRLCADTTPRQHTYHPSRFKHPSTNLGCKSHHPPRVTYSLKFQWEGIFKGAFLSPSQLRINLPGFDKDGSDLKYSR